MLECFLGGSPAEITFSDVVLANVCFLNERRVNANGNTEFIELWLFVLIRVNVNTDRRDTFLYNMFS